MNNFMEKSLFASVSLVVFFRWPSLMLCHMMELTVLCVFTETPRDRVCFPGNRRYPGGLS